MARTKLAPRKLDPTVKHRRHFPIAKKTPRSSKPILAKAQAYPPPVRKLYRPGEVSTCIFVSIVGTYIRVSYRSVCAKSVTGKSPSPTSSRSWHSTEWSRESFRRNTASITDSKAGRSTRSERRSRPTWSKFSRTPTCVAYTPKEYV